jgi:hypothetical protein
MRTADDCLKAAFAALLDGDTATRDRHLRDAEAILKLSERVRRGEPVVAGPPIHIGEAKKVPQS